MTQKAKKFCSILKEISRKVGKALLEYGEEVKKEEIIQQ